MINSRNKSFNDVLLLFVIIFIISFFNVDKKKEVKIQLKSFNLQYIKLPKR